MTVLSELHQDRESLLTAIELSDGLTRLESDPSFKKIITDLFLTELPLRHLRLAAGSSGYDRERHLAKALAAGELKNLLEEIKENGRSARDRLPETEEAILNEEMREQ